MWEFILNDLMIAGLLFGTFLLFLILPFVGVMMIDDKLENSIEIEKKRQRILNIAKKDLENPDAERNVEESIIEEFGETEVTLEVIELYKENYLDYLIEAIEERKQESVESTESILPMQDEETQQAVKKLKEIRKNKLQSIKQLDELREKALKEIA